MTFPVGLALFGGAVRSGELKNGRRNPGAESGLGKKILQEQEEQRAESRESADHQNGKKQLTAGIFLGSAAVNATQVTPMELAAAQFAASGSGAKDAHHHSTHSIRSETEKIGAPAPSSNKNTMAIDHVN